MVLVYGLLLVEEMRNDFRKCLYRYSDTLECQRYFEDTLALMKDATINIEHIYREGPSLAYYLTNHAFEMQRRQ